MSKRRQSKQLQIVFLGRSERSDGGYRRTRYIIDGQACEPTRFIGFNLAERFKPNRLLILGTPGSMWDCLLTETGQVAKLGQLDMLELVSQVDDECVDAEMLARIQPLVAEAMGIEDTRLALMGTGMDLAGQVDLLTTIAAHVDPGWRVNLDITHGLRHLPMIAMLSAMHLRASKPDVTIGRLSYASFRRGVDGHGEGELVDLSGAVQIADWVAAIETFRRTGQYRELVPLLKADLGRALTDPLEKVAFHEETMDFDGALESLREFAGLLGTESFQGPSRLVEDMLTERLDWAMQGSLFQRQRVAAWTALGQGRYTRAILLGAEAVATRYLEETGRPVHSKQLRKDLTALIHDERRLSPKTWRHFNDLRELRNFQAHIGHAGQQLRDWMRSPSSLEGKLRQLFKALLDSPRLVQDEGFRAKRSAS